MLKVVELHGHLSVPQLETKLGGLTESELEGSCVLVDCLSMTGYDRDARAWFTEWNRQRRELMSGVAVVTDRPAWRMVISAMSLASRQHIRAFDSSRSAARWIDRL